MLVEYLTGEEGGVKEQVSAAQISRLIIAGNSFAGIPTSGRGESADIEQTGRVVSYIFDGIWASLILIFSDGLEMKDQYFHPTLSSTYQPTYMTLPALCLFIFFQVKQIHLG